MPPYPNTIKVSRSVRKPTVKERRSGIDEVELEVQKRAGTARAARSARSLKIAEKTEPATTQTTIDKSTPTSVSKAGEIHILKFSEPKYVIFPVSTPGCGKTTIGKCLQQLFSWPLIQNDDIKAGKNKPVKFIKQCATSLEHSQAVYCDRNNHVVRERKQLVEGILDCVDISCQHLIRFICLNFTHDGSREDLKQVTKKRLMDRGDDHQTVKLSKLGPKGIYQIYNGFHKRFQPVNTSLKQQEESRDLPYDLVIDLSIKSFNSSRQNLQIIIDTLATRYPDLVDQVPDERELDDVFNGVIRRKEE